jgi:hypothetical protein
MTNTHPLGEIVCAPFDVVFTSRDVVQPDLLYFSHERGRSISSRCS